MTSLRIDSDLELLVDDETGEIIEVDTMITDTERVARWHHEYAHAKEQAGRWENARKLYGRALLGALNHIGVKRLGGDFGSVTAVPDTIISSCSVEVVVKLQDLGQLSPDQVDSLISYAAKALDPKLAREWLDENIEDEAARKMLAFVLIQETPRSGYALVNPPKEAGPIIKRKATGT